MEKEKETETETETVLHNLPEKREGGAQSISLLLHS